MTPRPDIVTVSAFDDVTAALDVAIEQGYSRLPVMNEDDDDVIGVVYAKDLMKAEREGRGSVRVTDLSHPVRFVPENKPVGDIMREMQADKSHMTMVADEYGEFSGVVTLEDCIEELVGDIADEFDSEEQDVERKAGGDYLIEGGTSIGDVNELLSLNLPDTDWATIGGYVFGRLGHVPSLGEAVDFGGWRIAVEEMLGRRIRRVRISVLPSSDHPEDDGAREGDGNGSGRFGGNGGQRR
jgi:CBS domain containing-hemolysin-like protein